MFEMLKFAFLPLHILRVIQFLIYHWIKNNWHNGKIIRLKIQLIVLALYFIIRCFLFIYSYMGSRVKEHQYFDCRFRVTWGNEYVKWFSLSKNILFVYSGNKYCRLSLSVDGPISKVTQSIKCDHNIETVQSITMSLFRFFQHENNWINFHK